MQPPTCQWDSCGNMVNEPPLLRSLSRSTGLGVSLLEEPELSLHTEVARQIPGMMVSIQKRQARQILVSTHGSDLLTDPGIAPNEVLLLRPASAGTKVEVGTAVAEIQPLLEAGLPIAEAVAPYTRPKEAGRLASFGEWWRETGKQHMGWLFVDLSKIDLISMPRFTFRLVETSWS